MLAGRDILATLIPHAGNMCLLESISCWDDQRIICHSQTHVDPTNPLRREGRLASVNGIEYAAQAAALHGALIKRQAGVALPAGRLAAVRQVTLRVPFLDDILLPLEIEAERLIATGDSFIYQFRVCANAETLVSGRLSVIAGPGQPGPGSSP